MPEQTDWYAKSLKGYLLGNIHRPGIAIRNYYSILFCSMKRLFGYLVVESGS